jgi:hypothetical protein
MRRFRLEHEHQLAWNENLPLQSNGRKSGAADGQALRSLR